MSDQFDDVFATGIQDDNLPDWTQESAPEPVETPTEAPVEAPQESAPAERPRDEHGRFIKAEEPTEETPAQPVVEEGQPEVEVTDSATERIWAGKYRDPEALETGYRELRDLQRRTAESRKATEQKAQELEFQNKRLEDALRRAIPVVQEAVRIRQGQGQDPYGNPALTEQPAPPPGPTPQQVQGLVDQRVQQGIEMAQQRLAAQREQQEAYQAAEGAITRFFERHPEVEQNGPVDTDLAATITSLNEAWTSRNAGTVDLGSDDMLDIAYEAMHNPALRRVLEVNPEYVDDDTGMAIARQLAAQASGKPVANPGSVRTSAPQKNTPFVERGSSPAPAEKPLDEFEEAAAELRRWREDRGNSVFFE